MRKTIYKKCGVVQGNKLKWKEMKNPIDYRSFRLNNISLISSLVKEKNLFCFS